MKKKFWICVCVFSFITISLGVTFDMEINTMLYFAVLTILSYMEVGKE